MLGHREDPGPASPGLETVSGKEAAETLASFLSLAPTLRRCLYQIRRAFCRLGALGTRKEGIRLASGQENGLHDSASFEYASGLWL